MNKNFWKNKKILITGHSGFTGVWLTSLLALIGGKIIGISLKPNSRINLNKDKSLKKKVKNYYFDIRNFLKLKKIIKKENPDIVIHLAAQSLVSESINYPQNTFTTNINGTINLLEALKDSKKIKTIMLFTTDKVYKNLDNKKRFKEDDPLGGDDPYSSSKASKEIIANSYNKTFFSKKKVGLVTIRSGNIIGGGDWGKNRLIPDLIRFNFEGKKISIRSLNSIRPWYHILDVLNNIVCGIEKIWQNYKLSGSYNIGPKKQGITVGEIIKKTSLKAPKNASFKINIKEKKYLLLSTKKSLKIFNIKKNMDLEESINLTMNWYKKYYKKTNTNEIIKDDLRKYFSI